MDAVSRFLDLLQGVHRNGTQAYARCPAHDDHNASLTVAPATKYVGVMASCKLGCKWDQILAAVGWTKDDARDEPRQWQQRTVVCEYNYVDENGKWLYAKRRFEPKDFRQYTRVNGEIVWSLNGTRRVLYQLPQVIEAIGAEQTIYLVEGEKDVHSLEAAGVVATTWSDGAWKPGATPKWRADYTQQLKGAHVVIVQDRDDAGRATAKDIATALRPHVKRLKIVEAAEGKDAHDHFAAGRSLGELVEWQEPEQNGKRRVRLTWANTITPRPVRWAWVHLDQGRIPNGHLVVVGGREGTGKSQFTLWLAAHITHGTLPGELAGKPRRVLIAATEDSWAHTIVPRLIAAGADLSMVARVDVVTETAGEVTITLPSDNSVLERVIQENDVALVILDPVLSVLGDTINDHRAKDVRTALEPLVATADRTGCLMVAIAHFNKGSGVDAATLLSGSHAFRDLPRAVFAFAVTKTEKVLSQVKNTLGRSDLPSLDYMIEPFTVPTPEGPAEVSKFVLGGVSHRDVADLLADAGDADSDMRNSAQDFLLNYLITNGLVAPASKCIAAGEADGYTADQMKNARARMRDPKVLSQKAEFGGGWEWRVEA